MTPPPDLTATQGNSMSAETKHTPGPWRYRPLRHDDWGLIRGPEADDGGPRNGFGYIVARAYSGSFETVEELAAHRANNTDPAEANARLIAAAPDMLDALKAVAVEADEFDQEEDIILPAEMRGMIRAAIAKVEGQS